MGMANQNVWVLVECISQYVTKYVVSCPVDFPQYALDTVTINHAKEFSQHYVGETILSYQVIDQEDALYQGDVYNEHYAKCDVEQKLDLFFTRENEIGYQGNN
jgi:hypothetical protein